MQKFPYQKQWEEYRRRRNLHLFAFVSLFIYPFIINAVLFFIEINDKKRNTLELMFFGVWAILYLAALMNFRTWKCPKCREQFLTKEYRSRSWFLTGKCQNCNFVKYEGSTFKNY